MDDEYDSWPESINPFTSTVQDLDTTSDHQQNSTDHAIKSTVDTTVNLSSMTTNTSSITTFAQVINNIIRSNDRLFFISYKGYNETRHEWKLVQINLKASMQKRPTCLQDGLFFVKFYIEHPRDRQLHPSDKRFWIEYHRRTSHKSISQNYHIIRPTDTSEDTAHSRHLIAYCE